MNARFLLRSQRIAMAMGDGLRYLCELFGDCDSELALQVAESVYDEKFRRYFNDACFMLY